MSVITLIFLSLSLSLTQHTCMQVSCSDVVCVDIKVSLKALAELLTSHKHNAFPVTVKGPSGDGQRGQFIGMVRRDCIFLLFAFFRSEFLLDA